MVDSDNEKIWEVSERGLQSESCDSRKTIQFYSTGNYTGAIDVDSCDELKLLPEFVLLSNLESLGFYRCQLYDFPDIDKTINKVTMPLHYYGSNYNSNFFNHVNNSIYINLDASSGYSANYFDYPNIDYFPNYPILEKGNISGDIKKFPVPYDLSAFTYNLLTESPMDSFFTAQVIKSPNIILNENVIGRYLFYNHGSLLEATVDPTKADDSTDSYLYDAFWGCSNLVYLHMPENSVKRQINLSDIATVYTDAEPRDNTMTVSQYAWTEIAKALHNYSGETAPSYTPTITLSSTIKTFLDTLTINGVNAKEYITNKGWTIA